MSENLSFDFVNSEEGIRLFWERRDRYMRDDIMPNCSEPTSKEEEEWFFSKEYRDHIMNAYLREVNKLHIAFFMKDDIYMGFVAYVIYHTEDGKCFILEYCIDSAYRSMGWGRKFFDSFKEMVKKDGATYFALNLSNERNEKFWMSNGFIKTEKDEYGSYVYVLK